MNNIYFEIILTFIMKFVYFIVLFQLTNADTVKLNVLLLDVLFPVSIQNITFVCEFTVIFIIFLRKNELLIS